MFVEQIPLGSQWLRRRRAESRHGVDQASQRRVTGRV
jgi:hypothetical protein